MARMWYALLFIIVATFAAQHSIEFLQQPGVTFTDLISTLLSEIIEILEIPIHIEINNRAYVMTLFSVLVVAMLTAVIIFLLMSVWTLSNKVVTLSLQMALMDKRIQQISNNGGTLSDLTEIIHDLSFQVLTLTERMSFTEEESQTTKQKIEDFISNTFMQFAEKYTMTTEVLTTKVSQTTASSRTRLGEFGGRLSEMICTLDAVTRNMRAMDNDAVHMKGRMDCFRDILHHMKIHVPTPTFNMPSYRRLQAPESPRQRDNGRLQEATSPNPEDLTDSEQASSSGDIVTRSPATLATPGVEVTADHDDIQV